MELFQDCGSRPIVFLRFNPDGYEEGGKKYKGCFKETQGLSVDSKEFKKRMSEVVRVIEAYKVNIPQKEVTVEQFFYTKA